MGSPRTPIHLHGSPFIVMDFHKRPLDSMDSMEVHGASIEIDAVSSDLHRSPLISIDLHRRSCTPMDLTQWISIHVDLHGYLFIPMDVDGPPWASFDFYWRRRSASAQLLYFSKGVTPLLEGRPDTPPPTPPPGEMMSKRSLSLVRRLSQSNATMVFE